MEKTFFLIFFFRIFIFFPEAAYAAGFQQTEDIASLPAAASTAIGLLSGQGAEADLSHYEASSVRVMAEIKKRNVFLFAATIGALAVIFLMAMCYSKTKMGAGAAGMTSRRLLGFPVDCDTKDLLSDDELNLNLNLEDLEEVPPVLVPIQDPAPAPAPAPAQLYQERLQARVPKVAIAIAMFIIAITIMLTIYFWRLPPRLRLLSYEYVTHAGMDHRVF